MHEVNSLEQLLDRYGQVVPAALTKQQTTLHPHYRALIEASPFCVLGTVGPAGVDCSPRGDAPGFVRIVDEQTLELPDRRGNNRLDSLRNIVANPQVSLLFLIPGRKETMRVSGQAVICIDPDVLASHEVAGKVPVTVLRIHVESAFYQCGKALLRSGLWQPDEWSDISQLPSTGTISAAFNPGVDSVEYDAALEQRMKDQMY